MKHLVMVLLSVIVLQANGRAHEVQENTAKISIQHGSVALHLSIHSSPWADSFAVHQLDDEILKNTRLTINKKQLPLKLKKVEKGVDHYTIQYSAEDSVGRNIQTTSLALPIELGNVVVTVVRATTKLTYQGNVARFSF